MNKLGSSAIHDDGFQFFLTLGISNEINELIEEIKEINGFIKVLAKWKATESFYNSKTSHGYAYSIRGLSGNELTLKDWKKIRKEKVDHYNLLIDIAERALISAKKSSEKHENWGKPFHEDIDRINVLIEAE